MWPMKTATKTAAALLAATVTLVPTAHAQDDVDWTGGRPLPPGTEVPYDPGYASAWKLYDVIRFGDPNFRNIKVQGVRVMGAFEGDSVMCHMNAKGGRNECYKDGKQATKLGWGRGGEVITFDPKVEQFAPLIRDYNSLELQLSSGTGVNLSS
ncbi:hypothetical protein CAFEL_06720 [Corynebacterium afermentans subsp. lipophilum]|nr:hypothetical protein CAFEL_06720 [Corynebacterium afermentans subsp. lipophilum]